MANEIDAFLTTYPAAITTLGRHLRSHIQALLANSDEKLHGGWKAVSYRQGTKVICSFVPHKQWINVQFLKGTSLKDTHNLLEGTGKTMRHVKVKRESDVGSELDDLILQSAALAE